LKPKVRLFVEPLQFTAGELVLSPGSLQTIDEDALSAHEIVRERFG
jgi:hypothetical protein